MDELTLPGVLIVDDDPDYLASARDLISTYGFHVDTAATIKEAVEKIHRLTGALVLFTDHHMKPYKEIYDGLDLIKYADEKSRFMIDSTLVSADLDHKLAKQALDLGAEYFSKEATPESAVNLGELYVGKIQAAYKRLKRRLRDQKKNLDPLTQLIDFETAKEKWVEEWMRAARHQTSLALTYVDVNDIKIINDTYGHDAGDTLFRAFGISIKHCNRLIDTRCRKSGDEFLGFHPEAGEHEAEAINERLETYLAQTPVEIVPNVWVCVSISTGIAVLVPSEMTQLSKEEFENLSIIREAALQDLQRMMKSADKKMYLAKFRHYEKLVATTNDPYVLRKYEDYKRIADRRQTERV